MLFSRKATSIIESIVVLLILSIAIISLYTIYFRGDKLYDTTKNRIEAIQIAREGIEAFTNIRDTNWLLYSSDYSNCWNSYNYNGSCISNAGIGTDILSGSYIIYQDIDNRRKLGTGTFVGVNDYPNPNYRNFYEVGKDNLGFYTQSGIVDNIRPVVTREIKVSYPEDTNGVGGINSNDEKMKVISLVQWADNSSDIIHKVELETVLTNWKNRKEN